MVHAGMFEYLLADYFQVDISVGTDEREIRIIHVETLT